ncbi:MAG TPA: phosphatase PAP2 family protein [Acidimicrobiales bacterium]|nr:phosphatase PAP2 family protein [Acidimicrobiales bacterium]
MSATSAGTSRTAVAAPERVRRFDEVVDRYFEQHLRGRPYLDVVMYTASLAAEHSILWLVLAGIESWQKERSPRPLARVALALGAESALVNGPVKALFRRRRPERTAPAPLPLRNPRTSSFPSGHASAAFFAAALLRDGSGARAYYPLAAIVAASRVYVRTHHASDVVAGAALGAVLGELARPLAGLGRAAGTTGTGSLL